MTFRNSKWPRILMVLLGETTAEAKDKFFPSTAQAMNVLGRERGWGPYTRNTFEAASSLEGALYVGDAETVAEKSFSLSKNVSVETFHCCTFR